MLNPETGLERYAAPGHLIDAFVCVILDGAWLFVLMARSCWQYFCVGIVTQICFVVASHGFCHDEFTDTVV